MNAPNHPFSDQSVRDAKIESAFRGLDAGAAILRKEMVKAADGGSEKAKKALALGINFQIEPPTAEHGMRVETWEKAGSRVLEMVLATGTNSAMSFTTDFASLRVVSSDYIVKMMRRISEVGLAKTMAERQANNPAPESAAA